VRLAVDTVAVPRPPGVPGPCSHPAARRAVRYRRRTRRKPGDLLQSQPLLGEPTTAGRADPGTIKGRGPAARRAAGRAAQQRMCSRRIEHPARRIPPRLGEERGIDHRGDGSDAPVSHRFGEHVPGADDRGPQRLPGAPRSPAGPGQPRAGHPVDGLPQPPRIGMQIHLRGTHRRMPDQRGDLIQAAAGIGQVLPNACRS
jgi:hypothetical protein